MKALILLEVRETLITASLIPPLSLVLRHHGKINHIVVGEVFHVVVMTHGAIMTLSGMALFYGVVVMESQRAANDEDHLRIALVDMQAARSAWTERGVHYLNVVVHVVACVQMTLTALEAREMSLGNLLEIYYHDKLDLYCCDLMLIVDDLACDRGGELGNLVQPQSGHGIGWHTPIASGRQRHGTHLGAVWQARTLKLLVDKPATERAKPMMVYLVGLVALALVGGYTVAKRLFGKHKYLSWAEAIA